MVQAFKFNLQTFLKVRKGKEEIMKMELARKNGSYQRINQELRTVMEKQHNNRVASDPAVSISDYIQQGHYQNVLRNKEADLIKEREGIAKDLSIAKENFMKAKKESTALEFLEEQHYEEYRTKVNRQRQIMIGEQSNQTWRKKHGE